MKKHNGLLALALVAGMIASAQTPTPLPARNFAQNSGHAPARSAVTEDEALQLAHKIEREANAGNPASLNHLIDPDLLVGRISEKSPILRDESFRRSFRDGVAESITNFGLQVVNNIKGGGYHLLRVYEYKGARHMLFRLHDGSAALNYHDFILEKVKDSVRASDCYIYVSDDYMSTTMSRLVNTMNAGNQANTSEDMKFLTGMIQLYQKKDYAGIKDYFEKADARMKDDKGLYLIYVLCCKKVDVGKYQEVLEHYITHFPDAASGYLMIIDLYYTKKEPEKGLVAVEKLDSLIGKDPFLDYYRGRCYDMQGKRVESIRCFEATYRLDPSFERNTIRLIVAYAANKENDKARTIIGEYKRSPVFAEENLDAVYKRFPDLK
ncbi:MAG: hypothetical protein JST42_19155 [Bacteroidetes bacterium]|nr:hypothetical protein [Bacteroidota bacterium]